VNGLQLNTTNQRTTSKEYQINNAQCLTDSPEHQNRN